ncbi:hypothetical protein KCU95_g598, partial [Aureobasidium melanogenum]
MSLSSGDDLVPPLVLPHVPSTSVKASSDVLTLTITLKTFGTVLYPPEIATFRPANSCDDADFEAFVNICHSTEVHLHFARAQFGLGGAENPSDRVQLRQFIGDFNTSQTLPADYDLVSADNGRGLLVLVNTTFAVTWATDDNVAESNVVFCGRRTATNALTSARLVDPDKKVFVYLMLDATNVKAMTIDANDEVPREVTDAFIKQARRTVAADLISLHSTLAASVPLIVPDSALQQRSSTSKCLETLLRFGQYRTFTVYVPSGSINQGRLTDLCDSLDQGVLKSAERHVKTLYAGAGSKSIMRLDELWPSNEPEGSPPYDPLKAPGVSNNVLTVQSDLEPLSSSRARGTAPESWELALAAQGVQITALRAEHSALCEEQQLQPTPVINLGTQIDLHVDSLVENRPRASSDPAPYWLPQTNCVSQSQTSITQSTIENRLMMVEDSIGDERKQKAFLNTKFDHESIRAELPYTHGPPPWSPTEVNTPTEVSTPTHVPSSVEINALSHANVHSLNQNSSTPHSLSPQIRPTVFTRGSIGEATSTLPSVRTLRVWLRFNYW